MDADLWLDGQRLPPVVTPGLLSRSECALRERRSCFRKLLSLITSQFVKLKVQVGRKEKKLYKPWYSSTLPGMLVHYLY